MSPHVSALRALGRYRFAESQAYRLLGQVGRIRVGNMIDPFYFHRLEGRRGQVCVLTGPAAGGTERSHGRGYRRRLSVQFGVNRDPAARLVRVAHVLYEDLVQNLEDHPLVLRLAEANHGRDGGGGPRRPEPQVVSAYILIQTESGRAARVAKDVAVIKGVGSAEAVAGPYDVIARADASSLDALAKLVVRKIQDVEGVTRTLTCSVVHL